MKRLLLVALTVCYPASAMATLKVGERAPDFALPDQSGHIVKLSGFRDKQTVVLAFYLRASTPG